MFHIFQHYEREKNIHVTIKLENEKRKKNEKKKKLNTEQESLTDN